MPEYKINDPKIVEAVRRDGEIARRTVEAWIGHRDGMASQLSTKADACRILGEPGLANIYLDFAAMVRRMRAAEPREG